MQQIEHHFDCPYCGAPISMLLEPMHSRQQYIEDCEVCCNPIQITFAGDAEGLTEFQAISIEQ